MANACFSDLVELVVRGLYGMVWERVWAGIVMTCKFELNFQLSSLATGLGMSVTSRGPLELRGS